MWNMIFLVTGAMFIALLFIIFFSKDAIRSKEIGLFKSLIIINCFEYITEISLQLFVRSVGINHIVVDIYAKLYLLTLLTWYCFFTIYTFVICLNRKDKDIFENHFSKAKKINLLILVLGYIILLILPFNKFYDGNKMYTYGTAIEIFKIFAVSYMFLWIVLLIKNYKHLKNKRYLPMFAVLLLGVIGNVIQTNDPSILTASMVGTFVCYIMYYTIENPDVKMINELNKNRELVNKTFEDKSNFLFVTSNQLKSPLQKIEEISRSCIENNDSNIESIRDINNLSNNLLFQVNNVMDISSLTYSNIKVINDKYNLNILLNKIRLSEENKVKEGVKFNLNINELVPKYLYGDSKLLEQVLISLVENAIKYTYEGFIDLNVDCIVKYDMCRLIFTIEDSGLGMTIDKINELLLIDNELSDEELKRLDTKNININTIKKLVAKLGGYFTIKSEVGKGTEMKVVVDQKIESENNINLKNVSTNQKILLASSNNDLTNHILKNLDKRGYSIDTSTYTNDILDRVRLNNDYEYIFIDDSMDKRAIEILKKLKTNPKFNTKVIVMIDKSLDIIKNDLIKDGFYDCIFKEEIDKELERILD